MAGTIKYSIDKAQDEVTHTISWDVKFGLIDKPRELLSYSKNHREPVFQLSLEIKKDSFDELDMVLRFLYPADAYISCILTYTDFKANKRVNNVSTKYEMREAHVWYDLMAYNKNKINVHNWELGKYVQFNLLIIFTIMINSNNNAKPQSIVNTQGFFITSLFSDAVIKSFDGKEYKVHKVIISSKSEVLKAHFQHDMTENDGKFVNSPFESNVLEAILSFIYCDEAASINDIPEKVLPAADYYQLQDLKSSCEKELCKKLTVENSIELLELADSYSAEILKKTVLNFMCDKTELLVKTEAWAALKSARIVKMIFENVKSCKEKETIYVKCKFA